MTRKKYDQTWREKNKGYLRKCRVIYNARHPIKRIRNNMYLKMRRRVTSRRSWLGLPICSKAEFSKWFNSQKFVIKRLVTIYFDSGKDRRLAPSVNRIQAKEGYIVPNLEIITVSENSILSHEQDADYPLLRNELGRFSGERGPRR